MGSAETQDHKRIEELVWYHAIDLGDGVHTPGIFDTIAALESVPLPASLAGKRCLDVGTADGFWAFEMERRGADVVVAIDIGRVPLRDLVHTAVAPDPTLPDPRPPETFELAHRVLDSRVQWRAMSAYDVSEAELGRFDFAFLGSLLLHLRDPYRALAAVRNVLDGELLVNDAVDSALTRLHPRAPVARMMLSDSPTTWSIPNTRGMKHMIEATGFEEMDHGGPYRMPFGRGRETSPVDPVEGLRPGRLLTYPLRLARHRAAARGFPHAWVRAAPRRDAGSGG